MRVHALGGKLPVMTIRLPFFLCGLLALAPAASATQVLALTLDDMVKRSEVIVHGYVASVVAERLPENRGRIHTRITVTTRELVVGQPAKSVEFTLPGGVVGELGQRVAGTPKFSPGEEVVLLLSRIPATGRLTVVGLSQGQFVVGGKPAARMAVSDRRGVAMIARGIGGQIQPAPAGSARVEEGLALLLSQLRALAARTPR